MGVHDKGAPPFITDMGRAERAYDVETGEEVMYLPRYAAWCFDLWKGKMQVAECSDDLTYLQVKYDVPSARVIPLSRGEQR